MVVEPSTTLAALYRVQRQSKQFQTDRDDGGDPTLVDLPVEQRPVTLAGTHADGAASSSGPSH